MVSVLSASVNVTSASRYQNRSSMYIRGLFPRKFTERAEAVPIDVFKCIAILFDGFDSVLTIIVLSSYF